MNHMLKGDADQLQYSWLAIDVIAAMLVDDNKRFLISFYC